MSSCLGDRVRERLTPLDPRGWELWRLPAPLLGYILAVHVAAAVAITLAAVHTPWRSPDLLLLAALVGCGVLTLEVSRRVRRASGSVFHDMQAVWWIAAATVLPPVYALTIPVVLIPDRIVRLRRGVPHRRAFSGSACGLAFGLDSVVFHAVPQPLAGHAPGTGVHVITWMLTVAACGALGLAVNNAFIYVAVLLSDPSKRLRNLILDREAAIIDVAQVNIAVLVALPVALNSFLLVVAVPLVMLSHRFLMHAQLTSESRMDAKTGLLNATTWWHEAELEVSRAVRTQSPLAIAIADLDHFKTVNDTRGHLAGDAVLTMVAATMRALLRGYDVIGRFGGEEFTICLPQTTAEEAAQVAERIRERISLLAVEAPGAGGDPVRVTVSIGIAALGGTRRDLTELMAAADAALYAAKNGGRNQVHLLSDTTELTR